MPEAEDKGEGGLEGEEDDRNKTVLKTIGNSVRVGCENSVSCTQSALCIHGFCSCTSSQLQKKNIQKRIIPVLTMCRLFPLLFSKSFSITIYVTFISC